MAALPAVAALPADPRYFDNFGPLHFTQMRIVIADIFSSNDIPQGWFGSPHECLAITASSIAQYRFTFVKGQAGYNHLNDFMQAEYCDQALFSATAKPQFVVVLATCLFVIDPHELFEASLMHIERMKANGIAMAGHIINVNKSLPYMHPQFVIFDAHMWSNNFGCPDLGPFSSIASRSTLKFESFPPYLTEGDFHDNYTPLFLHRDFQPEDSISLESNQGNHWFKDIGNAFYFTAFMARSINLNVSIWNVPTSVRAGRKFGYPMYPATGSFVRIREDCLNHSICSNVITLPENTARNVFDLLADRVVIDFKLKFSFQRSSYKSSCFDQADFNGCFLNVKPQYLGTNEGKEIFRSRFRPMIQHILLSISPKTKTHFMTVVGGMNCLHIASNLKPSSITFFDLQGSNQLLVGRVYLELIMLSRNRKDFISLMFLRNLTQFLSKKSLSDLFLENQEDYLTEPLEHEILSMVLQNLSKSASFVFEKYFLPMLNSPLEYQYSVNAIRSFTPMYKTRTKYSFRRGSGNFTVHYGLEGGYLESDKSFIEFRDFLRLKSTDSSIILADYDLDDLANFVRNPLFQDSDNVVIHLSNADDKQHYLYLPNFEGSIIKLVQLLRNSNVTKNIWLISTNGLYTVNRDGFTFKKVKELSSTIAPKIIKVV